MRTTNPRSGLLRMTLAFVSLPIGLAFAWPVEAQNLKVTLLGTGTPPPIIERFGPSILVQTDKESFLFDCGRGATQRLWQIKVPLSAPEGLFLTHLHSDHVVGIPDLWLTGWLPTAYGRRTAPLRVWGPAGTKEMMANLEKAFEWDIRIRRADQNLPASGVAVVAENLTQGIVYEKNGLKITAFDTDHGDVIKPTLGYRIEYAGRAVVLSGDTRLSENLIRFAQGADLVVHSVGAAKEELLRRSEVVRNILAHHISPEEAGTVFDRVKPKLAVYSHIVLLGDPAVPPPTLQELVDRTRKTYRGPLEVGKDLMVIEVGQTVQVRQATP